MKKVLSIALALALVLTIFVFPSTAAETETSTYCNVNDECLVEMKLLDDGTVPTYKEVETVSGTECLLVGIPKDSVLGDKLFQAKEGYSIKYFDVNENEITDPSAHIGTTDIVAVYNGSSMEAQYSIVTYGDADGDGVFDVIDATLAHLCANGFMNSDDSASIYEALKVRDGADDEFVMADDYTQIVNDCFKDKDKLEDNLKGRKFFVDDTIIFDTAVFAYDGKAKIPEYTADSNLKKIISLSYNGIKYNDEVKGPSAPGIYAVSATIAEDDRYFVAPGTRDIGFMVIAPDKGTGYTTKVDAANKKVIISVNDAYSDFTAFNTSINNWCSEKYSLKVNNKAVSAQADVLSALAPRSYNVYSGQDTKLSTTTSSAVLGSYLPADTTLYSDFKAANEIPVSLSKEDSTGAFTLVFAQDEAVVYEAIKAFEEKVSSQGRTQRSTGTYKVECYGLRRDGERVISAVVREEADILTAIRGNGLKSMMVGYVDSIEFKATANKGDYSKAKVTSMYNSNDRTNKNIRYSQYSSKVDLFLKAAPMIQSFLQDTLGMKTTPSSTGDMLGKTGWATYHCSIQKPGLRYGLEYMFEFIDGANIPEVNYKIITDSSIANGTISYLPAASSNFNVYESMVQYEPFWVTPNPASGYKTESVKVVDANGNELLPDETGAYIMPASNVTVTATFVKE